MLRAPDAEVPASALTLRLRLEKELQGAETCTSLDFAPEGTLITTCGEDEVRSYEPGTWRLLSTFPWGRHGLDPAPVNGGLLAAGSKGLIVVGFGGKIAEEAVFIRNLNQPKRPPRILTHRIADGPPSASDLCLGGGDRLLVVDSAPDFHARLYDPVNLVKRGTISGEGVWAVACDPRGELLVTAGRGVVVWSVAERRVVRRLPAHDDRPFHKVAIVGAMQRIVAENDHGWILAWDPQSSARPQVVHRGTGPEHYSCAVEKLQARAQGDWLLSQGSCKGPMLVDLAGKHAPIPVGQPGWTRPRSMRFSPDGKWLAATFVDGPLRIFAVEASVR